MYTNKTGRSFIRRLVDLLFGYDFFISYAWKYRGDDGAEQDDGRTYAVALNDALEGEGFECFLDSNEYRPGDNWRIAGRLAIKKTGRLILVVTRGAIRSEPVEREVEAFLETNRDVIPVDCEGILEQRERDIRAGTYEPTSHVLKLLDPSILFVAEDTDRLRSGPSEEVLGKIRDRFQGDRQDRKRVKWLTYAVVLFAMLAVAAIASAFIADWQRRETARQQLLTESASSVNEADLLRETRGPLLEQSLALAVDAYEKSRAGGEPSAEAQRAIGQALEILPERIGEAWAPFAHGTRLKSIQTIGHKLILMPDEETPEKGAFAIVADLNDSTSAWQVVHAFNPADYGELITTSDDGRWLATWRNERVAIWDALSGKQTAELPLDGSSLLAVSASGKRVLVHSEGQVMIWDVESSPTKPAPPLADYIPFAEYAISASGQWVAWAGGGEFVLLRASDGQTFVRREFDDGGWVPPPRFVADVEGNDRGVFLRFRINQVVASDASRAIAAIWSLGQDWIADQPVQDLEPDAWLIRRNDFQLEFSQLQSFQDWDDLAVVILDRQNPVQWLNVTSQLSHTIGAAAGPAGIARFDPQQDNLLVVHTDGTARLWDPGSRTELLRFASADDIVDAAFLTGPPEDDYSRSSNRAVVTVDARGQLQAWAPPSVPKTRLEFYAHYADSVGITPNSAALLFSAGQLVSLTNVEPSGTAGVDSGLRKVEGFDGEKIRINSALTNVAYRDRETKSYDDRDGSIVWIDLKTKTSKWLAPIPYSEFEDLALSEDGQHVVALFRDNDQVPQWLTWSPSLPGDVSPIVRPLQSGSVAVLDPIGRFVWQLTPEGELSRIYGDNTRTLLRGASKVSSSENVSTDWKVSPDGSSVAFSIDRVALVARADSDRVIEFPLRDNESVIAVSTRGLLALGEMESNFDWKNVRVVDPTLSSSSAAIWSIPGEAIVRSFTFARSSDWAAVKTDSGDVLVYSIRDRRDLARLPNMPDASRLEFVGRDRFLCIFFDKRYASVVQLRWWQAEDLISISRKQTSLESR